VKVKSLSHVGLLATPWDCSLPGSSIHGIFQARVLEWGAIAFSDLNSHIYTFAHITRCLGMVGTLACSWEQCSSFIWPYLLSINIRTTTSFKLTEYNYCVVFFFYQFWAMSENQKRLKQSYCFYFNGILSLKCIVAIICDTFMLNTFIMFSSSERLGCILNR